MSYRQYGGKGSGCRKSPKSNRCASYNGPDIDNCAMNPRSGRCSTEKGMLRRMGPKRQPTVAQLDALAKGRAIRTAKIIAKRSGQSGGYWLDTQRGAGCGAEYWQLPKQQKGAGCCAEYWQLPKQQKGAGCGAEYWQLPKQ